MEVFLALDIPPFVMYCVNGKPRSSLFIESTDSMIYNYIYIYIFQTVSRARAVNAQRANVSDRSVEVQWSI